MKHKINRFAIVLGAVMLMLSVVAPAMGAAPTVDTETTDTTATSEITDETTINGFDANPQNSSWMNASYDSSNASVEVIDPEVDRTVATYEDDDLVEAATIDSDTDGTTETWYYSANITHDDLKYVEIDSGESKNITVQLINKTTVDAPDKTNVTVILDGVDGRTVRYVGSDSSALSTGTAWTVLDYEIPGVSADTTTYEEDGVSVAGDGSTVTVHLANTSAQDTFDAEVTDLDAETWTFAHTVMVDGEIVKTYVNGAPDDANGTYAVYDTSSNDYTIYTDKDGSVDVSVSSEDVGPLQLWGAFGLEGVQQGLSMSSPLSTMPALGALLILFGSTGELRTKEED